MVANIASFPESSQTINNMQAQFDAQKSAYTAAPYPSVSERMRNIQAMKDALLRNTDNVIDAINKDFGSRSADETKLAEVMFCMEATKYYSKNVAKWMKPERRKVGHAQFPGKAKVVYQPLGVVGIIVPWNYPIYLAVGPLLCALAAGNRVMIKMSEYTPNAGDIFKKICGEIYSEDQVCIINGEADVGIAFSKLPFNHILFTGSTAVGKHIMRAAADNLTPVTLELGGKSPAIASDAYPMDHLVERLSFGKCFNAGQTCVSPDYLFLPEHRVDEFIDAFTKQVSGMYPTVLNNPEFTSVINERQNTRLRGYLKDAEDKGAKIIQINPANESFDESNKLPITLVLNVTEEMDIAHEEIFGPLLIIRTYKQLDDAINYINDRPRPLALYYFDYNTQRADYVLKNTHSGGACINDVMSHVGVDDMPFGGIGDSGMGHYHGYEGFLTFSKAKGVYEKGRFNAGKYILPPYEGNKMLNFIYKALMK